ncbi:MAG TPA: hypothetical protein DFR83_04040, partial [Deltaproteobacteria bacterium]|nr:hypothetical protein [Deltaproteobacteria bacterium]
VITCTATATDTDLGTGTGTASATVENTDPELDSISVTPSSAKVGEDLTCQATASDDDGGSPTISYAWSTGETGDTYTVQVSDDPGDVITCTATTTDTDLGTASDTASATVDNTAPEIDTISVTPSTGQVGDTLTCGATASDSDGGSPTITYAWSSGDTGPTYTIQASDDPGDTITCTATATDIQLDTGTDTASATVENTEPTVDSVSISPSTANSDDTLTCSATATDTDGGTPTLAYAWTGSSSGSLGSTDTIDLSLTAAVSGETITCTVTASDTDGGTDIGSATRDLDNRAPTVSVSLSPSSGATKNDTLTCTATVADDDDDSLATTFAWSVEGGSISASSTSGLTSTLAGAFAAGEDVVCAVTTDDGKGGTASDSASTTITNTAPTVSAVTLSASTVYTNDTLTASVTSSDADGDTLTTTYDWYVEGTSVQDSTSDTLNGASASAGFDKDETVYVIVSVTDGTDTTTSTSSMLTVANTLPEAPVVTIDPSDPVEGEELFCEVTSESFDADGDTVTYSMSWTYDSGTYSGASTAVWTDDTVDGADTVADEVWVCTATPNDGDDDGSTATDSVTIMQACNDGSIALTASSVDFVEVCAGNFYMGCTPGQSNCEADESPVVSVTLTRNYYLSQTEVTQGQYQTLMGTNPSYFPSCGTDCPVEQVSWHMAAAFANAMSAAEGLRECYDCTVSGSSTLSCSLAMDVYACSGYRLPTEAEWEGAARCGEDLMYPGSIAIGDVAWYSSNSGATTHPVAGLDPNACGLFDMSGNVGEWVSDVYLSTFYSTGGGTDPHCDASAIDIGFRGGGYDRPATRSRLADRDYAYNGGSAGSRGFRLVRTVDGDYDGDGYPLSEDCDDTDASVTHECLEDCTNYDVFTATGATQTWTGTQSKVYVKAWGGGGGTNTHTAHGGGGGYAGALIDVPSGGLLVVVGEGGTESCHSGGGTCPTAPAFGGGGLGDGSHGTGGGYSGVFDGSVSQATALLIAGGGGGGG